MNYCICDETALEYDLAQANSTAGSGAVSLSRVKEALPTDIVCARGMMETDEGKPVDCVVEVMLIHDDGLVVGEVSVLTREQALASMETPARDRIGVFFPELVRHLDEILFHLNR